MQIIIYQKEIFYVYNDSCHFLVFYHLDKVDLSEIISKLIMKDYMPKNKINMDLEILMKKIEKSLITNILKYMKKNIKNQNIHMWFREICRFIIVEIC